MSLRGISKHFGEGETRIDALRDISIDIAPGEVVALRGPSGSGKTTLLNVIACILDPSGGSMSLDGEVVFDGKWLRHDLRRLRLEKIGFIFQFHNLLPFLNAIDNVALVLQLAGYEPAMRESGLSTSSTISKSGAANTHFPQSFREARRSALPSPGRSPIDPASFWPTSPPPRLTPKRAQIVMDLLRKLAVDQNAAVIAVTHDEKIFDRFDRMFMLRDGRLDDIVRLPDAA